MIYWFLKTKFELNDMGTNIPTGFLFFIPLVNFYFIYQFTKAFTQKVLGDDSQTLAYFFLFSLLMPVGVILAQTKINSK
ncbi:hypothetical protein Noda2021_04960 [Candidatus Dependentiae bacterium Noda2021]|nr:hypothetical protein Noda2021_04960 [Candidatus Dependentiae bacterium Noda2021]